MEEDIGPTATAIYDTNQEEESETSGIPSPPPPLQCIYFDSAYQQVH